MVPYINGQKAALSWGTKRAGPKDPIYFESTFDDTQSPYSDDHVYSIKEKAYSNYWLATLLSLADAEISAQQVKMDLKELL